MANAIRAQLDALRQENRLTEAEREPFSPGGWRAFSPARRAGDCLAVRLCGANGRFNVRMRVAEALGDEADARYGGGEVLVQGTVDCCFLEHGGWILLDYKTDITRDREALERHYRNNSPFTRWRSSASPACRCANDAFACWLRAKRFPCEDK